MSRSETQRVLDENFEVVFPILDKELIEEVKNELEDVETKSKSFIEKFKNNSVHSQLYPEPKFLFVPCKESLITKIKNAVKKSQTSIDVITTCSRLQHSFLFISDDLQDAWSRGVKGRAIIEKTGVNQKRTIQEIWKKPEASFKIIESIPSNIIAIYDKKEVFIFTKPTSNFLESPALWSTNYMLLSLAQFYFESM